MTKKLFKRDEYSYSKERFLQLCEYVSAAPLLEDDEEDMEQQNNQIGQTDEMGQMNDMNQTPNDNNDQTQIGDESGQNDMMGQIGNDMGQNMQNEPMMQDQSFDNQETQMGDMGVGTDMNESDDEVIDVDDLTNAQEKVNDKVNHVGRNLEDVDDKISQLMMYIDKMESMINKNNEDIQAFKDEFERRNPTDVEKMNLRAANSYPFNVSPSEYWSEKEKEGRYSIDDDDNGVGQKKYEITNSDINNYNESSIAKSFHIDDDLRQSIEKIFDIK